MNRVLMISTHFCLALAIAGLTSCGLYPSTKNAPKPQRVMYEWNDPGGEGEVKVVISLKDQIARVYRGERQIGWSYVATGISGYGTPDGEYKVLEKKVDKVSNRYGWIEDEFGNMVDKDAEYDDPIPEGYVYVPAPMPYWMRLTWKGIGMHGGIIPNPGRPASHGCIRMPKDFVPLLYDAVDIHTPVSIRRSFMAGPRYREGIENLPGGY